MNKKLCSMIGNYPIVIGVDGFDGTGKTTYIKVLSEYLAFKKRRVVVATYHDPRLKLCAEITRELKGRTSRGNNDKIYEAMLYAAMRREIQDKLIVPALDRYATVIIDRTQVTTAIYNDSPEALDFTLRNPIFSINLLIHRTTTFKNCMERIFFRAAKGDMDIYERASVGVLKKRYDRCSSIFSDNDLLKKLIPFSCYCEESRDINEIMAEPDITISGIPSLSRRAKIFNYE